MIWPNVRREGTEGKTGMVLKSNWLLLPLPVQWEDGRAVPAAAGWGVFMDHRQHREGKQAWNRTRKWRET